jgi:hypothetical protein
MLLPGCALPHGRNDESQNRGVERFQSFSNASGPRQPQE